MLLNRLKHNAFTFSCAATVALGLATLPGCTSAKSSTGSDLGTDTSTTQPESNTPRADNPARKKNAVAFLYGKDIDWNDLLPSLVESGGGQVLIDKVLDIAVEARLKQENITLTEQDLATEKQLLAESLSDDPNMASRLLTELRQRKGLGDARFSALLRRQAGFRAIVQPEVLVTDSAMQQAYQALHGPRYEVRIIVTRTLPEVSEVQRRITAGESFMDLAIKLSIDSSRAQGGLLSPISPADPTYPDIIRRKLPLLEVGQVSDALTLPNSFAILKLERKIEGDGVKFDDVKEKMSLAVRRMLESQAIQRAKRDAIRQANVIILDAALKKGWEDQLERLNKDAAN